MSFSPLLTELINALRCLPTVGPKSAQRMAFSLLKDDRKKGRELAHTLLSAIDNIQHCKKCRTLTETDLCLLCESTRRDPTLLCVVESPADILSIENTARYQGLYFVLMGHLSPLDGIGPQDIGIPQLNQRFQSGEVQEVILATGTTVEGEATAHYIAELAKPHKISTTRLAHGIPIGGDLEYIDGNTLAHAFMTRVSMTS